MNHSSNCPVCNGTELVDTVQRSRLPAMQNYVYRTPASARDAKAGEFCLAVCESCGFSFNRQFDAELLTYDQSYDNSVPSAVMRTYYEQLADYFNDTYLRGNGLIVDVGCGKGTFLDVLSRRHPGVRALGIDPSYEGPLEVNGGQLRFIRDIFREGQLAQRPDLVICRHVLEHIERPVEFLASLRSALDSYPGAPIFVEVPDLKWILGHEAFWDFCYEHCNYFTAESFAVAVARAGFAVKNVRTGFGDQYLWLEATTGGEFKPKALASGDVEVVDHRGLPDASAFDSLCKVTELIAQAAAYVQRENSLVGQARERLLELRRQRHRIVLWGMATKGVLYSHLVDPECHIIHHCVDINANKHGCFTPVAGHRIENPSALAPYAQEQFAIVVMNENYFQEIASMCGEMGLSASFLNASGQPLAVDSKQRWRACA